MSVEELLKEVDRFDIEIESRYGTIQLTVLPVSDNDKLFLLQNFNEGKSLEALYQMKEGCRYNYIFSDSSFQFLSDKATNIITTSKASLSNGSGTINTGIYVGTLTLEIIRIDNPTEIVSSIQFEVQSKKMDYRTDYQTMLTDIAQDYAELVMSQGAPVTQYFEVDTDNADSKTLYQRFAFVKSIVESKDFANALDKIIHNPVKRWSDTNEQRKITSVRRLTHNGIRQLTNQSHRTGINPINYGLPLVLTSLPTSIEVVSKKDTFDILENQFIKYVLTRFLQFCIQIGSLNNASTRLKIEASQTENILQNMLSSRFFKDISKPRTLAFNSPVLQRKEGYREVMQACLFFDLAAKLTWNGGDNIYSAGKRNVAALYEYWVFFQLKKVISEYFQIDPKSLSSLVKTDNSGINLELCQGKMQVISGVYQNPFRNLKVEFFYNKTFSYNKNVNEVGSWSIPMRPDYTLVFWPDNMTLDDAEKENLAVYIHFDAKYRLKELLFERSEEEMDADKAAEAMSIYKQGDILKMHAYKDAIRRTAGAYVIYPGDINREFRGFHEVIPGLGAFDIKPGEFDPTNKLKTFIRNVVGNLLNRSSMRERMATHEYMVLDSERSDQRTLRRNIPESTKSNRNFIPDETTVMLGYCKGKDHEDWIKNTLQYNQRAGERYGSLNITVEMATARYLLLHDGKKSIGFYKIVSGGPKVLSRQDLSAMGYPKGKDDEQSFIYLVYRLEDAEENFSRYHWDMRDFKELTPKSSVKVNYKNFTDVMLKSRL